MVVPFGEGKRYRRYNPFVRTSWSMTTGVLLMLLSSGAFGSCFDCGGGGDNDAYADRVPCSAHILVSFRIPTALAFVGGGAFEVDG